MTAIIPQYRCGDTIVEAMQWPSGDSYTDVRRRATIHRWVWGNDGHTWVTFNKSDPDDVYINLETTTGNVRVDADDWIIRGVLNTFYRMDNTQFWADFEAVS